MSARREDDIHQVVARRLHRVRQRYTAGRRELVELLVGVRGPVTIPDILGQQPALSQSSVYRNLHVLEQAGAVRRVVTTRDPAARFELAEDLTHHHHHLVCTVCGSVEDFHPTPPLERALRRVSDQVADHGGFTPDHHRVDLVGVCGRCA